MNDNMNKRIFRGDNKQRSDGLEILPEPPPWREFASKEIRAE